MDKTAVVNVIQEQWDYLIVLDACRYDYFKEFYQHYLPGVLSKRISVGSSTPEWRDKSFPGFYEGLSYVSTNPFINGITSIKNFCDSNMPPKVIAGTVNHPKCQQIYGCVSPNVISPFTNG